QVPLVAIDGRYVTSPSVAGEALPPEQQTSEAALQRAALQVMDILVARSQQAKGGAAPAPAASAPAAAAAAPAKAPAKASAKAAAKKDDKKASAK
ncbi:MAG TPA: hypothetical protein VIT92_14680, partial [Burkholderiaceae bacterium]